jgi:hypothetical protein
MAQITIEVSDELAQRLEPFQSQLSELFTRLIATNLPSQLESDVHLSPANPVEPTPTYLEFLDFLVSGPTSEQILTFKVSDQSQTRLRDLLQKNRDASLNPVEMAELDLYEQLDALVSLLKVRAHAAAKTTSNS